MKTSLLPLAMAAALAAACSQNPDTEPAQDYTSFVFTIKNEEVIINNAVSGYFDSLGYCHKIAAYGILECTRTTEITTDEAIAPINVDSIYFFFGSSDYDYKTRLKKPFILLQNKKNVFNLNDNPEGIYVLKSDSMKYPQ